MTSSASNWREAAAAEYAERRAALVRQRERDAKTVANLQKKIAERDAEISDLDRGAKVFGLPVPDEGSFFPELVNAAQQAVAQFKDTGRSGQRQFKDVAVELLAHAYPEPLKAAEIQEGVQRELGRSFHWKTAGMTLFRLKKDFQVSRHGQNWFFVPPEQRAALRAAEAEAVEMAQARVDAYVDPTTLPRGPAYWAAKYAEIRHDPGEQGPEDEPDYDDDGGDIA